jgi:hypothetical protein
MLLIFMINRTLSRFIPSCRFGVKLDGITQWGVTFNRTFIGIVTADKPLGKSRLQTHHKIILFFTTFISLEVCLMTGIISLPQWTTDWLWRPQFVQGCTLGQWDDPKIIRTCNEAYYRFRQHQANGWKE